jgi:hypothetical protein
LSRLDRNRGRSTIVTCGTDNSMVVRRGRSFVFALDVHVVPSTVQLPRPAHRPPPANRAAVPAVNCRNSAGRCLVTALPQLQRVSPAAGSLPLIGLPGSYCAP